MDAETKFWRGEALFGAKVLCLISAAGFSMFVSLLIYGSPGSKIEAKINQEVLSSFVKEGSEK